MNKGRKSSKKPIAISVAAVLVVAVAVGTWLFVQYRNDRKTVQVLPVLQVTDYYWGDQSSSSGNVVTDYVQELYMSSDKVISEIYVSAGDEVRIGDPLLQYDKTKLELDLEAKEIAVKQADLNITTAQKQLKKLQNTKPVATASPTQKPTATKQPTATPTAKPTATPSPTPTPVPPADVTVYSRLDLTSVPHEGRGTSDDPYVFLCTDNCVLTPEFMQLLLGTYEFPEEEPTAEPSAEPDYDDTDSYPDGTVDFPEEDAPATPEPTATPTPTPVPGSQLRTPFAAVFEVREGNSNYGALISSFKLDGSNLSASIDTSNILNSYNTIESIAGMLGATPTPSPTSSSSSDNYNDMGYTSAQLSELITEKKQEIQNLQLAKKQAQLDLERAKLAVSNTTVLSTVDGIVKTLSEEADAQSGAKPFIVISGASEYYVIGALSESMLGSIGVGDEVTVNEYSSGGVYTAQIVSISDYPLESDSGLYYYGSDNPNSSVYEFTAVVLDADEMQNGQYVDIILSAQGESDDALYVQNAYLREDAAGTYVMKAGSDNRLVKQYVRTGRTLYGSSTEIKSGLTQNDYIAFPYGTDVKEGVRVVLESSGEPPYSDDDGELNGITVGGYDDGTTAYDDYAIAFTAIGGASND